MKAEYKTRITAAGMMIFEESSGRGRLESVSNDLTSCMLDDDGFKLLGGFNSFVYVHYSPWFM
jgi:hypothetical protein